MGKEAGHGEVEDKARADRDAPAANRSGHREWEEHRAGLQGGRGHRADVLPLAEGVRGAEAGPGAAAEGAREGKCPPEAGGGGPGPGEAGAAGRRPGKLLSLERRRSAVAYARGQYGLSERHACRLLGQWRGSQRYTPTQRGDEDALTRAIVTLAGQYGRYGYRRITALLQHAGWHVGKDRVQCIWRRGAESPCPAGPPGPPVAGRRLVWAAPAGAGAPRLELRLRQRHDTRRAHAAPADPHRRIHSRVPGHPGGPAPRQSRGARDPGRGDAGARHPRIYPLRPWPGVHRPGAATVAGGARGPDAVHRPGQSVGERLLRELQRQAARRMLKRRALLFPEGGADRDRTMAAALQQAPAALRVGLPAAGPGGLSPEPLHERSSTPPGRALDSHSAWYKTSVRSSWLRLIRSLL